MKVIKKLEDAKKIPLIDVQDGEYFVDSNGSLCLMDSHRAPKGCEDFDCVVCHWTQTTDDGGELAKGDEMVTPVNICILARAKE